MDVSSIGIELLQGIGLFFLHPLFYLFVIFSIFLGFFRVKRERQDFHTRIYDVVDELITPFFPSIVAAIILSVIIVGLGLVIPIGVIALFALIQFILMLTGQPRWLSSAYSGSLTLLAALVMPEYKFGNATIDGWIFDINHANLTNIALLMGILIIFEGLLIIKNGHKNTSPRLLKSKRGKVIGSHHAQKLWVLPLLLVIPSGAIPIFDYWPVLQVENSHVGLILVPFAIGYQHVVRSTLPSNAIIHYGKRVLLMGLFVLALSGLSLVYSIFVPIVAVVAFMFRELIGVSQKLRENQEMNMYTQRENGLVVLGVIPQSPATKMNVQIGEVVSKVNGVSVKTSQQFYEALQLNSAFCKLEIIDENGQIRFGQTALYDGKHHQIGILFVHNKNKDYHEKVI